MQQQEKLNVTLTFVTEFMRQIIENGQSFSQKHLFLLLQELSPQQVESAAKFLQVVVSRVAEPGFDLMQIRDAELRRALEANLNFN